MLQDQYRFKVIFWKNGFSVNDGPLRTGESGADQAFLQSIHEKRYRPSRPACVPPTTECSECPTELLSEAGGKEPVVDLVDKSGQEYVAPPKPKYVAFSGAGQSLG